MQITKKKLSATEKRQVKLSIISICLVMAVFVSVFAGVKLTANAQKSVTDKVRLNAYYGITDDTANQFIQQNDVACKEWALKVVDESLEGEKVNLTEEERAEVEENFTTIMNSLNKSGNIKTDDDGKLTDLSKSYIANAVTQSVMYIDPEIDTKSSVDAGNTTYQQVIAIDKSLEDIMKTNEVIIEALGNANLIASGTGGDDFIQGAETGESGNNGQDGQDGETLESFNTESITRLLQAEQTSLYASMYTDQTNFTNEDYEARLTKLEAQYQDLLSTQKDAMSSINNVVNRVEELTSITNQITPQITELSQTVNTISNTFTTINETMTDATQDITKIQNDISESQEDLKKDLEEAVQNNESLKNEVEKNQETTNTVIKETQTQLETQIKETETVVNDTIKETQTTIEKQIQENQTLVEQHITENVTMINNQIEETNNTVVENKTYLENKITETQTTLETQITNVNNTLVTAVERLDETDEQLQTQIDNLQQSSEEMEGELTEKMESLGEMLQDELETLETELRGELKDEVQNIKKELNNYISAASTHSQVDVLSGIQIVSSGDESDIVFLWEDNGDGTVSAKIMNTYFTNAQHVEVFYHEDYGFAPSYTVNNNEAYLKITIDKSAKEDITIDSIIIYSTVVIEDTDDTAADTDSVDNSGDAEDNTSENNDSESSQSAGSGESTEDGSNNDNSTGNSNGEYIAPETE